MCTSGTAFFRASVLAHCFFLNFRPNQVFKTFLHFSTFSRIHCQRDDNHSHSTSNTTTQKIRVALRIIDFFFKFFLEHARVHSLRLTKFSAQRDPEPKRFREASTTWEILGIEDFSPFASTFFQPAWARVRWRRLGTQRRLPVDETHCSEKRVSSRLK